MPMTKKEVLSERNNPIRKMDGRTNGSRNGFRTDTAISNNRLGSQERVLQPWVSDSKDTIDGSLEKSGDGERGWDQFSANEKLFGLTSDYDENLYTTTINRNHPQYRERMAAAERKAREIERSAPATTHVAEERVMDYVGGKADENEEDKYSGVRRQQEFPALSSGRENRYTPPAKRAPTGQATVKGAPVDPAIISSQIKAPKKQSAQSAQSAEQSKPQTPLSEPSKHVSPIPKVEIEKPVEAKSAELKAADAKPAQAKPAAPSGEQILEKKAIEKVAASSRATPIPARNTQPTIPVGVPSAALTVERDVLSSFKTFAMQQRLNAEKVRANKVKVDKEGRLTELKNFANNFKLSTPVPKDLVSIIAKDPVKQKEIQEKARKNAEEMTRAKVEAAAKLKAATEAKDAQPKQPEQPEQAPATAAQDARPANRAPAGAAGAQATPPSTGPNRHSGPRQQYASQQYHNNAQGFRNNRAGAQQHQAPSQHPQGTLGQRIRNTEQQKFSQPGGGQQQHHAPPEARIPPTGPSNTMDAAYPRRHNGHPGAKLNPNSNEFRPSPFAASFSPSGHPSTGSSPQANPVVADAPQPLSHGSQLIRRKTKNVDVNKCYILAHIKRITPPAGRNWDDNGGIRPPYDTLPTWRSLQDDEKTDSTMLLSREEHFLKHPFSPPSVTPNTQHVVPQQLAHQHQLPFHLQQGAHNMPPRQSPHIPPMQMHAPQHVPMPHQPYGNDDHRMMHSNSAQSFASPRPGQLPVAYAGVTPPGQVPYNQPVFIGAGNAQMGQFRSFSNNVHYGPPHGQMVQPMMMQPQFIPGPHGMMTAPQMMYPGAHHPQFMPPSGPPQPMPGPNGYPSPGRPAAPMMAHQGSQQSHNNGGGGGGNNSNNNNNGGGNGSGNAGMYAMSPNMPYSQPNFGPGQTGTPMPNARAYNGPGPQPFSTSPQQPHHLHIPPNNIGGHPNKNHGSQGYHSGSHGGPRMAPGRATESSDEAK